MSNNTQKQNKFIKWAKIIRQRSAIVGSDGQINPYEENISDDHIYIVVRGGPLKIMRVAAQYKKMCR